MSAVKVTSKGQITIPIEARRRLGSDKDTYLEAAIEGESLRLSKHPSARPLGAEDPIWKLVGAGENADSDVSNRHDDYLAEGERAGWRSS